MSVTEGIASAAFVVALRQHLHGVGGIRTSSSRHIDLGTT